MQSVIILLYCNAVGVAWMVSGRGSWDAKTAPQGAGCLGFPAGRVYPQKFIFVFLFFVFCNSLTLNILVLFMYHFGLLSIDKILI